MEQPFWQKRWQEGRIGFHRPEVNPLLLRFAEETLGRSQRVLVPMAGKSRDIDGLVQLGYEVVAVEFVPSAVQDYFDERGIGDFHTERTVVDGGDPAEVISHGKLTFLRGDFFAMPELLLRYDGLRCDAVYDRAAMIAIDPMRRAEYVECLLRLLPADSPMLLVALEYIQEEFGGPPFSLSEMQLHQLQGLRLRRLETSEVLSEHQHFADQGMSRLQESVYAVRLG